MYYAWRWYRAATLGKARKLFHYNLQVIDRNVSWQCYVSSSNHSGWVSSWSISVVTSLMFFALLWPSVSNWSINEVTSSMVSFFAPPATTTPPGVIPSGLPLSLGFPPRGSMWNPTRSTFSRAHSLRLSLFASELPENEPFRTATLPGFVLRGFSSRF